LAIPPAGNSADNHRPSRAPSHNAAAGLELADVNVAFRVRGAIVPVVRGLSLKIRHGESVALVGESGSGKSVSGLAILGLIGNRSLGQYVKGRISFTKADGERLELSDLGAEAMRSLRGAQIAMIFQEPMTALNPIMRVGQQIAEVLRTHRGESKAQSRTHAIAMLAKVGIPEPERRFNAFPHQLSGGMRQRVMVAMALVCNPVLLIADEPTTALDVTVQAQILELLRQLQLELGTAILLITHDLGVVAQNSERVAVMYAGVVMEDGPTREVLERPAHPYTSALLRSRPQYALRGAPLKPIGGSVPELGRLPRGCVFHPRCAHFEAGRCDVAEPLLEQVRPGHAARCVRWRELTLTGR
jgi:oligopeptide/dipeptide ABC transporter ATP-binding protein